MANIKVPKTELKKIVKDEAELIEKINMMGTPVEGVDEKNIEIQILPNRPDLISMPGFLRSFALYMGKTKIQEYKISKSDAKIIVDKSVEKVRPYSMAAIVKGVKFTDERIKDIMQWQEKIHATVGRNRKKVALGYYDLSKIKFPVKYLTKSPKDIIFEPLDMPEKMDATRILSRHPCGREYGPQLEGFDKFPVYYDSNNEVLSMPPIINSNNSGKIKPGISDVLIECSGSDLSTLKKVITLAVLDLIDQGGKAYSVEIVYGNKSESITLKPEKMKISLENTNKLLGLDLKEKDIAKLLEKMGHEYKNGEIMIAPWRLDILHEVDIIEDIAIAFGYDNLIPEIPKVATIGEESQESKVTGKIAEILTGLGLLETSSLHLIKDEEAKIAKLEDNEKIELENSKSEYKLLRPNLLIPAMRIFSENKDNEYPQKIFEMGSVFMRDKKNETETGIKESNHLFIASSPGNFTEVKQILDYLMRILDVPFELKEKNERYLIEGRTGVIIVNNKEIGFIGEVHPETLSNWGIKMPVALIEIILENLI